MARFMKRFQQHMRDDPALRAEYERLGPHFRRISASVRDRYGPPESSRTDRGRHSGSQ